MIYYNMTTTTTTTTTDDGRRRVGSGTGVVRRKLGAQAREVRRRVAAQSSVYRLYATRAGCCAIARFTADYSVRVHGNGPEEKEDRESAK